MNEGNAQCATPMTKPEKIDSLIASLIQLDESKIDEAIVESYFPYTIHDVINILESVREVDYELKEFFGDSESAKEYYNTHRKQKGDDPTADNSVIVDTDTPASVEE